MDCAIRELPKELGLRMGAGDVLGLLDDFDTRPSCTVVPVVIWSGADPNAHTVGRRGCAHLCRSGWRYALPWPKPSLVLRAFSLRLTLV